MSCVAMAMERDVMGSGDAATEPRSMRIGSDPESVIMMLPVGRDCLVSQEALEFGEGEREGEGVTQTIKGTGRGEKGEKGE